TQAEGEAERTATEAESSQAQKDAQDRAEKIGQREAGDLKIYEALYRIFGELKTELEKQKNSLKNIAHGNQNITQLCTQFQKELRELLQKIERLDHAGTFTRTHFHLLKNHVKKETEFVEKIRTFKINQKKEFLKELQELNKDLNTQKDKTFEVWCVCKAITQKLYSIINKYASLSKQKEPDAFQTLHSEIMSEIQSTLQTLTRILHRKELNGPLAKLIHLGQILREKIHELIAKIQNSSSQGGSSDTEDSDENGGDRPQPEKVEPVEEDTDSDKEFDNICVQFGIVKSLLQKQNYGEYQKEKDVLIQRIHDSMSNFSFTNEQSDELQKIITELLNMPSYNKKEESEDIIPEEVKIVAKYDSSKIGLDVIQKLLPGRKDVIVESEDGKPLALTQGEVHKLERSKEEIVKFLQKPKITPSERIVYKKYLETENQMLALPAASTDPNISKNSTENDVIDVVTEDMSHLFEVEEEETKIEEDIKHNDFEALSKHLIQFDKQLDQINIEIEKSQKNDEVFEEKIKHMEQEIQKINVENVKKLQALAKDKNIGTDIEKIDVEVSIRKFNKLVKNYRATKKEKEKHEKEFQQKVAEFTRTLDEDQFYAKMHGGDNNPQKISSLLELYHFVLDKDKFVKYVEHNFGRTDSESNYGRTHNYFATWIENKFDIPELAQRIRFIEGSNPEEIQKSMVTAFKDYFQTKGQNLHKNLEKFTKTKKHTVFGRAKFTQELRESIDVESKIRVELRDHMNKIQTELNIIINTSIKIKSQ
ncbi:MAG: hypothetical protein ACMXYA_02550, partial [Candidatus Woesearchaeota archaeon]